MIYIFCDYRDKKYYVFGLHSVVLSFYYTLINCTAFLKHVSQKFGAFRSYIFNVISSINENISIGYILKGRGKRKTDTDTVRLSDKLPEAYFIFMKYS